MVEVRDVAPETMGKLLQFIYCDELNTDMMDTDLCAAADKYEVLCLKAMCEKELLDKLTVQNASDTVIASHLWGSNFFEETAIKFVAANCKEIENQEE